MRLPAHETTTAHLGAAYPFAAGGSLSHGLLVGRDLLGGSFCFDPFDLYARGAVTNPNTIVFGQIGRGKSAFVKTWLWRQAAFGRRALVIDPKGEYGPLARALGCEPIFLRPGGDLRVNPLSAGEGDDDAETAGRRRLELLGAVATACCGRRLAPGEWAAIELGLAEAARRTGRAPSRAPTLPDVVAAMLAPAAAAAREIGTTQAELRSDGREIALELRRLVSGDLRGMFDGQTSPGLDPTGRIVVLDLSAVYHSGALGALMTCAAAWLQSLASAETSGGELHEGGTGTILVVDEAWAILAEPHVARWLQASWKLSRARGIANVAVVHRVSDLRAAGAAGSEESQLATGLLADSETLVLYGQPTAELATARDLLGISSTEEALLAGLPRGVALWRVAGRPFLVRHLLSPDEVALVDTDARMAANLRQGAGSGDLSGTGG